MKYIVLSLSSYNNKIIVFSFSPAGIVPLHGSYLIQHRPDEARKVLQRIRGPCHNIDDELEAIKASVDESERELGVNENSESD